MSGFQQLVDEVRLQRAGELLENTAMNLSQIADALGYADAANFTRAFKRFDDCLEVYSAFAARLECGTCQQSLMASDTPTDPME